MSQPTSRPIYFGVDQDITTPSQVAAADAQLGRATSVLGRQRLDFYGERDAIEHGQGAELATMAW